MDSAISADPHFRQEPCCEPRALRGLSILALLLGVAISACSTADLRADAVGGSPDDAATDDESDDGGMDGISDVAWNDTGGPQSCTAVSDCPVDNDPCETLSCVSGICQFTFKPKGFVVANQTNGNCHVNRCDGSGTVVSEIDDANVPNDGKQCTRDLCQAGVASNPPVQPGMACTDNGGDHCSAHGDCIINQTFFIVRVGDGSTGLTSAASPVFLEEQQVDGTMLRVIPLPTMAAGANHRFTDSGVAKSDGALARSADGRFVVLAGYDAAVGSPQIVHSTASASPRIVARVDRIGSIDTSTSLINAFDADNVRSAVTIDGTAFWVGGNNVGGSGLQQLALGGTTGTPVLSNVSNVRVLAIVDRRLFGSAGTFPFNGIFTVGAEVPTTPTSATPLPGSFAASESPYGFVLLDLSATVAGPDTLYVADDRSPTMGGGIQKWKYDGSTWTNTMTFGTTGFRGLAGVVKGPNVWLLASTADPNGGNNLVAFVDDNVRTPVSFPGAAVDGMTKVFRGIAVSPQ